MTSVSIQLLLMVAILGFVEAQTVIFNGTVYTNNSVVMLTDIGVGNHGLLCHTDNTQCCRISDTAGPDPIGEWYFPNGDLVPDGVDPSRDIFRNRGLSIVRLNRRNNAQSPTGLYRCEIPDASGTVQNIYINLITDIIPTTATPPVTTPPTTPPTTGGTTPPITTPTTPPSEPVPSRPTSLASPSQSPTSITLSWQQSAGDVVDRYDIVYTYQGGCNDYTQPENMATVDDGTTREYTLQNLQEFSDYSISITADSSIGPSTLAVGTFTTGSTAPSSSPDPVMIVSVTFSNIVIQWGRVSCIDRNSVITGYTVRYGQTGNTPTDISVLGTSDSDRMFTASELIPGTNYDFQVAAVNSEGMTGVFSSSITVETSAPTITLNGTVYTNNSVVLLTDIGEGNHALLCHTDNSQCCGSPDTGGVQIGEWYFPDGNVVLDGQYPSRDMFRNRGTRIVRLNRRNNAESPTGLYRCEIPDASGTNRNIYINLVTGIIPTTAPPPVTTPPTTPPTAPPTTPPSGPIPSPPTSLASSSQSPTSITLSWEQPAGDVVDRYDILYTYQGECSDYTQPENMATVNDGNVREYTLESLEEFSAYAVSVFAVNGARRSSAATAMATTAPSAPSGATQSLMISEVASTSITIRWSRVSCIDRNSEITGYTVRYGQTGSTTTDMPVSGTTDSDRMFTASGLIPRTSYDFQVAAVNSGMTGIFNSSITVETSVPTITLNGMEYNNDDFIMLTDIGVGDQALLCQTDNTQCCSPSDTGGAPIGEWYFPNGSQVPDGQGENRDIFRNRGTSIVRLNRRNNAESPTGPYHCEIPDASGTNRSIYINLITGAIPTTAPPPVTTSPTTVGTTAATTPPTTPPSGPVPSPPTSLASPSQSSTSITLSWEQPAGDVVDRYDIVYTYQGGCSDYTQPEDLATVDDGMAREYTLQNLQEFTAYSVSVFAVNDIGRSSAATTMATTAPSAPSGATQSLMISEVASTSITIRWSRVSCIDRNSAITGYTVRYGQTDSTTTDMSVLGTTDSDRMFSASGLIPGTSYTFEVAAVSSEGTGPFSITFSLKTMLLQVCTSISAIVAGVIIGASIVGIAIILTLIIAYLYVKKRTEGAAELKVISTAPCAAYELTAVQCPVYEEIGKHSLEAEYEHIQPPQQPPLAAAAAAGLGGGGVQYAEIPDIK